MITAFFRPGKVGTALEVLNGVHGDLITIADPTHYHGPTPFTGDTLDAIRAAQHIAPSPKGIEVAAAAAKAAAPRTIATAAFIAHIPDAVWAKVQAVATPTTNPSLAKALFQLAAGPKVTSNDPTLLTFLQALVTAGVITEAERTQILSF